MYKFLVITAVISTFTTTVLSDVSELPQEQQNKSHLDPINDDEAFDNLQNNHEHDKRTIFKPNLQNVGWAKHVGISPAGRKVVLGFSPIDLKLSPVVRPLRPSAAYSYPKPSVHFRLKKPRPTVVRPAIKPRPVYGPPRPGVPTAPAASVPVKPVIGLRPPHVDIVHNEPIPHVDHVQQGPFLHQHGNHIHFGIQQIPHLHLFGQGHVDQVHQIQVPHGGHFDTFSHIDHLHPVPVPVAPPVVPIAPALKPFFASPTIFEVTKPNLGVLPLGAVFQTPVLREIPAPHLHLRPAPVPVAPVVPAPAPVVPVAPPHIHPIGVVPQPAVPVHHHPVPVDVHPGIHLHSAHGVHQVVPAGQPTLLPHPTHVNPPGTVVEYHGTRHVFPLNGQWPVVPHTPSNAVQPVLPAQQPVVPQEQHDVQTPFLPANHPNFQQQLVGNEEQGYLPPQDLNINSYQHFQQDFPNIQQFQPHEAIQQPESYVENYEYNQNNAIQPGQSDMQFPLALPQHPFLQDIRGFQGNSFQDAQQGDQIVKPSITLEPPYKK